MNIFVLSMNQHEAARYHCDKHVVKMVLETAQLLCTAHHMLEGSDHPNLYKPTHQNHPCAIWVRESSHNYDWAFNLFEALSKEYTHRFDKEHLSWTKLGPIVNDYPSQIVVGDLTDPPQCMDDDSKVPGDVVEAYRKYYHAKRDGGIEMKWRRRETPYWMQ